jgi:hypothetical protein
MAAAEDPCCMVHGGAAESPLYVASLRLEGCDCLFRFK